MMEEILVGDDNCSYKKVYDAIYSQATSNILAEKWSDFASNLEVPGDAIQKFKTSYVTGQITLPYIYCKILENWRCRKCNQANLSNLMEALQCESSFNILVDRLKDLQRKIYSNIPPPKMPPDDWNALGRPGINAPPQRVQVEKSANILKADKPQADIQQPQHGYTAQHTSVNNTTSSEDNKFKNVNQHQRVNELGQPKRLFPTKHQNKPANPVNHRPEARQQNKPPDPAHKTQAEAKNQTSGQPLIDGKITEDDFENAKRKMESDKITVDKNKPNLIIYNLPESQNETNDVLMNRVVDAINAAVGVPNLKLEFAYRIGKRQASLTRPVKIRFENLNIRNKVFTGKKNFQQPLIIYEDLPPEVRQDNTDLWKLKMEMSADDPNVRLNYNQRALLSGKKIIYIIHGRKYEKEGDPKEIEHLFFNQQNRQTRGGNPQFQQRIPQKLKPKRFANFSGNQRYHQKYASQPNLNLHSEGPSNLDNN